MTYARRPLVVANWKMNGGTDLIDAIARVAVDRADAPEVVICPPFVYLSAVAEGVKACGWSVGGQDCHWESSGAYTGEVSAGMLVDCGCRYVLIGHSERRQQMGETDEYVLAKFEAACRAGLVPVVCIGETLEQYRAEETFVTLASQLYPLPRRIGDQEVVIAYEPVWAIGSGLTPTPEEVQGCHHHIRVFLATHWSEADSDRTRVLYGGSVQPDNMADFMALADVDGVLVGGASLDGAKFARLVA